MATKEKLKTKAARVREEARETGYITESDVKVLNEWRKAPDEWRS